LQRGFVGGEFGAWVRVARWERGWWGGEVGDGDLEGLEEQAGPLEIHAVAGETGRNLGDGVLDGGAVVEALDEEWVVLDDGGNVVVVVGVAHVLVVHGGAPTAGAIFLGIVHALVGFGRLSVEVLEGCGHDFSSTPPGRYLLCC